MSTTGSVSIDEDDTSVTIESLRIEDPDLVNFLSEHEPDQWTEVVTQALTIGTKTMRLMDTSQDVQYVEQRLGDLEDELTSEVEEFKKELDDKVNGDLQEALNNHVGENGKLQEQIEAAFDEDGAFVDRLDKELGEDGERIQSALDPDTEGTPIYRLEERIKREIDSVREQIVETETREELRGRTYLKGGDFEDSVQDILANIVRQTSNNVEFTGDTKGEMDRDVGDFVVSLAETGQRIVLEAKTESYSTQNIKDEMQEAIQNRDAAYGVFVTDSMENLPRTKTGWFHEFPDQNTVVVAMSETDDEEIDPGYLRIAFNWARMRAVQSHADLGSSFDPEELQSQISEIEEDMSRFKKIRGQCTEIKKSRKSIEETLDDVESDIKGRIGSIETELIKADST